MRITPDLIENSYQYTNRATSDRELRLRSLKIPTIENLGATLNQFDCFDLSDNDIRKLENFPLLPRLRCLLLNNNRISQISQGLHESIPQVERLILTNNYIQELGDIDPLMTLPNLRVLSLINNPVATKKYYRQYVIHQLSHLRLLDFKKIKSKEREEANKLFSGQEGQALLAKIRIKSKAFSLISDQQEDNDYTDKMVEVDDYDSHERRQQRAVEEARAALEEAKDLESIDRINSLLRSGYVPGARSMQQQQQNELLDQINLKVSNQNQSNSS